MRVFLLVACILFAGCASPEPVPGDDVNAPEPPETPSSWDARATLQDCPDIALLAQMPIEDLQAELPAGYVAGEAVDFLVAFSPFADLRPEAGATPMGAIVVFIQQCQSGTQFEEGYTAIYIRAPPSSLSETGLNFFPLQHGMNTTIFDAFIEANAWPVQAASATVDNTISDTGRRGMVSWSDAEGVIATVDATGLPGHPPIAYDALVRLWQPVNNGTVVYDHAAAGNMFPGVNFSCNFAAGTEAARLLQQNDCQAGPNRIFSPFILQGHNPTLSVQLLP